MDHRSQPPPRELHSSNAPPSAPPLNLKVMRLSRPNLSHTTQPFYEPSSAPDLDAHARASLLTAGAFPSDPSITANELTPTPTGERYHPLTMVDFPLSSLLTLPGSFGAISLGETFTSAIHVSNDTQLNVQGATLKVEIQAGNGNKNLLAEVGPTTKKESGSTEEKQAVEGEAGKEGGDGDALASGKAMGTVIKWEIKELGTHMLVCEVGWVDQDGQARTFRKVYKFQVTNPLSVKTKVHLPSTPTTTLSPSLRSLVYLELHIQNTSPAPLFFSKMLFEPTPGLTFKSLNEGVFDSSPLLNPGDTRQVCFVVDERGREGGEVGEGMKRVWEAGTALPLGRMDINWLSPNGEPGRLVTSTLHRRVPAPPPPPPPAPPLQHPHPPQQQPPLLRTNSSLSSPQPRQHRALAGDHLAHQPMSLPPTPPPPPPPPKDDAGPVGAGGNVQVDLVVLDPPSGQGHARAEAKVEEVWSITLKLMVLASSALQAGARVELRFRPSPSQGEGEAMMPLGSSVLEFELGDEDGEVEGGRGVQARQFEIEYVPMEVGLVGLAGVMAYLVQGQGGGEREVGRWESLGEVWVGR